MSKEDKNDFKELSGEQLLKEAVSLWARNEHIDIEDPNSPFYKIENDPVLKLFMMALAHQTNIIKGEIYGFKENVIEEFTETVIPPQLVQPVPAMTIIQTVKETNIKKDCFASEKTPFILEREKENIIDNKGGKGQDYLQFTPLFKTKIIDAKIASVRKIDLNAFQVRLECIEPVNDLKGVSFYISTNKFSNLTISANGKALPLITADDFDKLPFTEYFNNVSMLLEKSLLYGTLEYWRDIIVAQDIKYFIVEEYDTNKLNLENYGRNIDLVFEFASSDTDLKITENDIRINCIPVINVEKQSVKLSHEKPFQKIADESFNKAINCNDGGTVKPTGQKQFINLLATSSTDSERDAFTMRRFGMERFNKNELLLQIKGVLNKFRSDYYAFMDNDGLQDGDKIKKLSIALKDVYDEVRKEGDPNYGIYLVLNKKDSNYEQNKSIEVSYLLTDGTLANGIKAGSIIKPVSSEFKKEAKLLKDTSGGKDIQMDKEIKKNFAQYYILTKDRLITKSDIRSFCYKELLSRYSVGRESIAKIDITNKIESSSHKSNRIIYIEISIKQIPVFIKNNDFSHIENQLKKMIEIRSMNFYSIQLRISKN